MHASIESLGAVKSRSRVVWPAVLTLAAATAFAASAVGCIFVADDSSSGDPVVVDQNPPPSQLDSNPQQVVIDTDQTVNSQPGQGVGLFVEYATGGHWHVYAT